jgi:DNA invertase Pin-like site-specific DNA recombinase
MSAAMIAAIYARKSTEQSGVADDQKSVARQIEQARAYAARKGWMVDDTAVFSDDGISGAEFASRPGCMRLLNALRPQARFHILIVSELSRLGREQLETGYASSSSRRRASRSCRTLKTGRSCSTRPLISFLCPR